MRFLKPLLALALVLGGLEVYSAKPTGGKPAARKATGGKRAAAASKGARNARSNRARNSAGGKATRGAEGLPSTAGTAKTRDCRSNFAYCMDAQIAGLINANKWLAADAAAKAVQSSAEPLRCIYYDSIATSGIYGEINKKECAERGNNMNVCPGQKDVNDLYMSYNYYCDLDSSTQTARGVPVNKCNFAKPTSGTSYDGSKTNKTGAFATRDSWAFYNEALRRVNNGDLKIINFETTNLYKNKISKLELEHFEEYSISNADVGDMMSDLGLGNSNAEIFSINVTPPVGAGTLDGAGLFRKASDLCFSGTKLTPQEEALYGKAAGAELSATISAIASCAAENPRSTLERYYLSGLWTAAATTCREGYSYNTANKLCVHDEDPTDTEDPTSDDKPEQTGFLSAHKSCDLYEQALITSRNDMYGQFETQMKNYIE
ncbi:MAG: hypothetical protein LBL52_04700, partial [Rickettsiales bacterium]|nr:hypothetical protein [Rickettsiales bacterium]